jgi:ribosomal protein S18 acetylase RimI-like enzyme
MRPPPAFLSRAARGDLPGLLEIERDAAPLPWSAAHFEAELEVGGPLVLRGREGVLAFCAPQLVREEVYVRNLAVRTGWRRRGLGLRLLELTLTLARRSGASRAVLEVRAGNVPARALYEKAGFGLCGRRAGGYTSPPEEALVLERDLAGCS